jgi:hypothetical protein
MANYKYKGIGLNTILSQESWGYTNNPKYPGLGYSTTNIANSSALTTGYRVDGQDIRQRSVFARARHSFYENTGNYNIPDGVNQMRFITIGGGGGGGGGGGWAIVSGGQ